MTSNDVPKIAQKGLFNLISKGLFSANLRMLRLVRLAVIFSILMNKPKFIHAMAIVSSIEIHGVTEGF